MIPATVRNLWRYPVKSMRGERGESFWLDQRGMVGDRLYAVRDEAGEFGSGKTTTRRFRRIDGLFGFRAIYEGDTPLITFPDDSILRGDDPATHAALSAGLGVPVSLSREADISHFDDGPLHLLTTASLRTLRTLAASYLASSQGRAVSALDVRRFRPNILVDTEADGFPEESWLGHDIAIGSAVRLRIVGRAQRCVMVNMAQDKRPDDARILRAVAHVNAACLGVFAEVVTPGPIRFGDHITTL